MEMSEERLVEIFRQLPNADKNSIVDFMEYLASRKIPNRNDDPIREQLLNEMISFLNSLTTEKLSSLIWIFRGMEFSLQTDPNKQEELIQKMVNNRY